MQNNGYYRSSIHAEQLEPRLVLSGLPVATEFLLEDTGVRNQTELVSTAISNVAVLTDSPTPSQPISAIFADAAFAEDTDLTVLRASLKDDGTLAEDDYFIDQIAEESFAALGLVDEVSESVGRAERFDNIQDSLNTSSPLANPPRKLNALLTEEAHESNVSGANHSRGPPYTELSSDRISILVFYDSRLVTNPIALLAPKDGVKFIPLTAGQNQLQQITNELQQQRDIEQVHLITHGSVGQVELGTEQLNITTLLRQAKEITAWRDSLAANAQLLIYGCEVGAGQQGTQFMDRLAHLTGANVFASDDVTGPRSLGGDWNLEVSTSGRSMYIAAFRVNETLATVERNATAIDSEKSDAPRWNHEKRQLVKVTAFNNVGITYRFHELPDVNLDILDHAGSNLKEGESAKVDRFILQSSKKNNILDLSGMNLPHSSLLKFQIQNGYVILKRTDINYSVRFDNVGSIRTNTGTDEIEFQFVKKGTLAYGIEANSPKLNYEKSTLVAHGRIDLFVDIDARTYAGLLKQSDLTRNAAGTTVPYYISGTPTLEGPTKNTDTVFVGNPDDVNNFTAHNGTNVLIGGSLQDTFVGGKGKDDFVGGANVDTLTGGLGVDTYVFDGSEHAAAGYAALATDIIIEAAATNLQKPENVIVIRDDVLGSAARLPMVFEIAGAGITGKVENAPPSLKSLFNGTVHNIGRVSVALSDSTFNFKDDWNYNFQIQRRILIDPLTPDFATRPDDELTDSKFIVAGASEALGKIHLDFSAVTDDLMFEIKANGKVSVTRRLLIAGKFVDVEVEAENVHDLTGGKGNNTFVFAGSDAKIYGDLSVPDNGTSETKNTLDYSKYDAAIEVNLSDYDLNQNSNIIAAEITGDGVLPRQERWRITIPTDHGNLVFPGIVNPDEQVRRGVDFQNTAVIVDPAKNTAEIMDPDKRESILNKEIQAFGSLLARKLDRFDFTVSKRSFKEKLPIKVYGTSGSNSLFSILPGGFSGVVAGAVIEFADSSPIERYLVDRVVDTQQILLTKNLTSTQGTVSAGVSASKYITQWDITFSEPELTGLTTTPGGGEPIFEVKHNPVGWVLRESPRQTEFKNEIVDLQAALIERFGDDVDYIRVENVVSEVSQLKITVVPQANVDSTKYQKLLFSETLGTPTETFGTVTNVKKRLPTGPTFFTITPSQLAPLKSKPPELSVVSDTGGFGGQVEPIFGLDSRSFDVKYPNNDFDNAKRYKATDAESNVTVAILNTGATENVAASGRPVFAFAKPLSRLKPANEVTRIR